MRLGEALATCPELVLVDPDPAGAEREWEGVLRRLEDAGFAVEPVEPGVVVFETRGVERLYGGVEAALRKALASVGPAWDPRAGAGQRRFVALAAASVARPGQAVIVEGEEEQSFLEPLPLSLLPLDEGRYAELEGLGVRTLGTLAALPGGAVAERLGQEGKRAWSLARGGERRRVRGRSPAAELIEALSFPEAVANELTLRRAFGALLDRLLARPERAGRPFRKLALSARLVGGGSWRRTVTLREAIRRAGPASARRSARSSPRSPRPWSSCGSRRSSSPSTRAAARARRARGGGDELAAAGRASPGARERGRWRGRGRRRGRTLVADPRGQGARRAARCVTGMAMARDPPPGGDERGRQLAVGTRRGASTGSRGPPQRTPTRARRDERRR